MRGAGRAAQRGEQCPGSSSTAGTQNSSLHPPQHRLSLALPDSPNLKEQEEVELGKTKYHLTHVHQPMGLFNRMVTHRTPVRTHSSYFISLIKLNISWLPTEQVAPCLYFLWLWMHGFQNQSNNSILKIFLRLHTPGKPMTFILLKTTLEKTYAHNNVWKCIRYIISPNITFLRLFKIPGHQFPPHHPVLSHKLQDTSILSIMQVSKRASFQDTNTEDLFPPPQT